MVKKLNPIFVQQKLQENNLIIFTPREFQYLFDVSIFATSKFLHQHTQKKFFTKLRNGLYCLSSTIPNSFVVANKLYQPSYISLGTALSFYGILPETTYEVTSVSTKATRIFESLNKEFSYTRLKSNLFTGYILHENSEEKFLIAEPEKALLDYFYIIALINKKPNCRLNISKLNKTKIKQWQKLFNNPKVNQLISELYAD